MNALCLSLFTYYSIVNITTIISVIITSENIKKNSIQIPSSIKLHFFIYLDLLGWKHDVGNEN